MTPRRMFRKLSSVTGSCFVLLAGELDVVAFMAMRERHAGTLQNVPSVTLSSFGRKLRCVQAMCACFREIKPKATSISGEWQLMTS